MLYEIQFKTPLKDTKILQIENIPFIQIERFNILLTHNVFWSYASKS